MFRALHLKGLALACAAIGIAAQSLSQGYSQNWSTKILSAGGDVVPAKILVEASINVFLVLNTQDAGAGRIIVKKFSSAGNELFDARVTLPPATSDVAVDAVIQGTQIVVAGTTVATGSTSREDLLVFRVSSTGTVVRQVFDLVPGQAQKAVALVAGPNEIYVTGTTAGSNNTTDIFTTRLSNAGAAVWTAVKSSPFTNVNDFPCGIVRDTTAAGSNIYVGATLGKSGQDEEFLVQSFTPEGAERFALTHLPTGGRDALAKGIFLMGDRMMLVGECRVDTFGRRRWFLMPLDFAGTLLTTRDEFLDFDSDALLDAAVSNAAGDRIALGGFSVGSNPQLAIRTYNTSFQRTFASFSGTFVRGITLPQDNLPHTVITALDRSGIVGLLQGVRGQRFLLEPNMPAVSSPLVIASRGSKIYTASVSKGAFQETTIRQFGQSAVAVFDRHVILRGTTLSRNAAGGLLSNDMGTIGGSASLVSQPGQGSLTLLADGSFTYTPPESFIGSTFASYRLTAAEGLSDTSVEFVMQPKIARVEAPRELVGGQAVGARVFFETRTSEAGSINFFLLEGQDFDGGTSRADVDDFRDSVSFAVPTRRVSQDVETELSVSWLTQEFRVPVRILAPRVASLSLSPGTVIGGQSFQGTVTLTSEASGNMQVALSDNTSVIEVPATVQPSFRATSVEFTGTTLPVATASTRTVFATANGVTKSANLTLLPGGLVAMTVNPGEVVGGTNTTGTLRLSGPAPAGGVPVALTSNSTVLVVPASVTVPEGATTQDFTVTTRAVGADAVRTITASWEGRNFLANIKLRPAFTITSFTANPATVQGGQATTGTITLNQNALPGGSQVNLTSGSSAIQVPASVTVPQGANTVSFTMTTSRVGATATRSVTATIGSSSRAVNITLTP